jgi:hypothetical protein
LIALFLCHNNLFFISLIWSQRAIPLYGEILPKRRSTNLQEQQNLITPVFALLQNYQIIILGDREFGFIKLAQWLCDLSVKFVLRVKQERYIQSEESEYQRLSELGLMPEAFIKVRLKLLKKNVLASLMWQVIGKESTEITGLPKGGIC